MSDENSNKPRKVMKRRSWVWKYFDYDPDNTKQKCSLCANLIESYGSSTCELIRHLTNKHDISPNMEPDRDVNKHINTFNESNDEYSTSEEEVEDGGTSTSDKKLSKRKQNSIDTALLELMANNNLPFRLVESESFQNIFKLLNKNYRPPCRETLRYKKLPELVNI